MATQNRLASTARIVNLGLTSCLGLFLTRRLGVTSNSEYFSEKEMRLFFLGSSIQPMFLWLFWDQLNIETVDGHYKKSFKTSLFVVGSLYLAFGAFPKQLKWLMVPIIFGKLIAFKDWCQEMPHFKTISSVSLFSDLIWSIGYMMAFKQLFDQSRMENDK